jgi:hypothetical protein
MNPPWGYGVSMPHQMVVGRTPAYNPDEQQRAQVRDYVSLRRFNFGLDNLI